MNTRKEITMHRTEENRSVARDVPIAGPHHFGSAFMAHVPTLAEEAWRIVDEGDHWTVWFVPSHHSEQWHELAVFSTETEARDYIKAL
jgi:hypothetical protein